MTQSPSPRGWDEVAAAAEQALALFAREEDDVGLAQAWRSLAMAHHARCRFEEATQACECALRHARAANATREESRAADLLCMCLVEGPTPVNAAVSRIEKMLERAGANQLLEANVRTALAELRAMECRFGEARALYHATERVYENLGVRLALAGLRQVAGAIELYAGDAAEAERLLRSGYELLPDVAAMRAYHGLLLASALYELGRYDDAQRLMDDGEELARAGGVVEAVTWARLRAPLLARAGRAAEAEQVIRDAMSRAEETDALNLRGRALVALAEVLQLKGDADQARDAVQRAIVVFDRKRNLAARREAEAMLQQHVTR
jgi:tetratricopeptide (TPR) repeat protein